VNNWPSRATPFSSIATLVRRSGAGLLPCSPLRSSSIGELHCGQYWGRVVVAHSAVVIDDLAGVGRVVLVTDDRERHELGAGAEERPEADAALEQVEELLAFRPARTGRS
jgi:hypothetical protein